MEIKNIRSDKLPKLRTILDTYDIFKDFAPIEQFEIILDANIIIRDILWVCTKRKNPSAKSELQELFMSQTIIAQAPFFLKEEVLKHLHKLSIDRNIKLNKMLDEWHEYEKHIVFYDVEIEEHEKEDVRDPKDLPYIKLQEATGAIIHTKDKDIEAMGGSVMTHSIITNLKDYSRDAAIEYTLKVGGVFVGHISIGLILAIGELLNKMFLGIKNLPRWIQWTLIGIFILILLNKSSRAKVMLFIKVFFSNLASLLDNIIQEAEPFLLAHEEAKVRAIENLDKIKTDFNKD